MLNILITGAGSTLGFSIIKTVKSVGLKCNIITTDYFINSIGFYDSHKSYILPDVLKKNISEENWVRYVNRILIKEKIDIVLIGLDFEVELFSKNKHIFEKDKKCKLLVSDYSVVDICNDKWKTFKFLNKNGFLTPQSCLPSQIELFRRKNKFPFIVKPRNGSTSKHLNIVKNEKELFHAIKNCPKPIIQKYVGCPSEEYTVGSIYINQEVKSTIALKRILKNGNTSVAYKENYLSIEKYVECVVRKLMPLGPVNVQLRKNKNQYIIFEINPRFSGTIYIRNIFGINEIAIVLKEMLNIKRIRTNEKIQYGRVIRYFDEKFISNQNIDKIIKL